MGIRSILRKRALAKRPGPGTYQGFSRSEKILITGTYPKDTDRVNHLKKALEGEGKSPEVIYYYPKIQKDLPPPDHPFITEKDRSFAGIPSKGDALEYSRGLYDILIDVSGKEAPFPDLLVLFGVARLKVGRRDRQDLFQLVIRGESGTFTSWIEQLFHYLKIINENV